MASRAPSDQVLLLGFDFGSTTSSMLAVEASIASNCATGRMELRDQRVVLRPEPIFTPFADGVIDLNRLRAEIERWLAEAGLERRDVFAGGAIVTGLAAERDNADQLARMAGDLIGEALVATADDPRLEAWLAFMGGCGALSRAFPDQLFLNFDIGGGTTNPATGQAGQVGATGSYFIGARHLEFEPGSYRLRGLSTYGAAVLEHLKIGRRPGDLMTGAEAARVADFYADGLVALAENDEAFFDTAAGRLLTQAPFRFDNAAAPVLTFSGGVGELVYAMAEGQEPPVTAFGDLGVDLARAILGKERLVRDIRRLVPEHRGRATVQGLTLNNTEISGTTLFLSGADSLPIRDLPVVASLGGGAGAEEFARAVRLAGRSGRGACLQIVWDTSYPAFEDVKRTGLALGEALAAADLPDEAVLAVLTTANVGKALGNYATGWRTSPRRLMIIDEIPVRNAHFVNIGRLKNGVVPVSFYGMA